MLAKYLKRLYPVHELDSKSGVTLQPFESKDKDIEPYRNKQK